MRRTAIALALAIVVLDVVFAVLDEVGVFAEGGAILDLGVGAFVSRLSLTVASILPWFVGALLLLRGRRGMGSMMLVAGAVLAVPDVLRLVRAVSDSGLPDDPEAWAIFAGDVARWLLAVAAGYTGWRSRPELLRQRAPGLTSGYTVLAFLAWLSVLLSSTQFLPPGSDEATSAGARHIYELSWDGAGALTTSVRLSDAVLFGLLLLLAPRVRSEAAGALILAVAVPALIREGQTLIAVLDESFLIPTPASIVGLVGMLGTIAIALVWIVRGLAASAEPPPPPDASDPELASDPESAPDPELQPEGSAERREADG